MAICDQAAAAYRELESCSVSEELAVAGACYQYLQPMLSETQGVPFSKLLHATFGLADSDEDLVEKLKAVYSRKIDEIITNLVEDELRKHNTETPTQYLVENVIYLYHLLETTSCVIICGPPSSGKTSVIQLLTTILEKEEMRTAEFVTLKPFNSIRLFHDSDKPSRVYGTVYNDLALGYTWQYGLIHATVYKLLSAPSEKASLLHFDGPLNQFFERYITEFLGESGGCKCGLDSLDSYRFENSKVIIETDSLANASPALLGKARVLSLHNMQTTESVSSVHPSCELVHPTLPFARAQEFSTKAMHLSSIPIIRSIFCEIAPTIVKRVYHTKNMVCYSEADTRMEYGNIILSEVLPMYAAALAFSIIDTAKVDCTDDDKVTDAMVLAFFRIFSRSLSFVKFGTFSSLKLISKKAFCSSSLFEICIPDSVEVICGECFYSCMCLLRMTFGESSSLKRLGNLALCDTILRSFAFPESVACVGESLFSGRRTARCVMYDINYSLDACDGLLLGKDRRACSSHIGVLQRAVIPDSVEELCGECFLVHRCPPGLMPRTSSCSRGTFDLI